MARDAAERYASAAEMAAELRRWIDRHGAVTKARSREKGPDAEGGTRGRLHRPALLAAGLLGAAGLAAAWLALTPAPGPAPEGARPVVPAAVAGRPPGRLSRTRAPRGCRYHAGVHDACPRARTARLAHAFRHTLRVYWEDTDAGGVVFYANYLKFFERARTEWLRALGFGQQALRERTGAIFVVTDTRVRYLAPARLDDLLDVTVEPARPAARRR